MSYRMSFTSGGLLVRESLVLAQAYQSLGDWKTVKEESLERNLLQSKKPSSAKRNIRELCDRLGTLTEKQFGLLLAGDNTEQVQMLWLAVAKTYRFVREFSAEVVREKFLKFDYLLSYEDFDSFFNAKAEWDNKLDGLSDSTRKKIRQVLFRMLHEADILTSDNRIVPTLLGRDAVQAIQTDDPALFTIFPASELDIQEWSR
jgi:hypothetical protein